jgi:thiamine pyrophosphate-dependent acetolactate synthase large subunit-like protein
VLDIAIREAVGKRGVSVVVIPGDVALQAAVDAPPAKVASLLTPRPVVMPEKGDLDRLAALLNGEGKVTILCGSGCAGARDELLALGERIKAPMVHALRSQVNPGRAGDTRKRVARLIASLATAAALAGCSDQGCSFYGGPDASTGCVVVGPAPTGGGH